MVSRETETLLEVHQLSKSYGDTPVVAGFSLEIAQGEIICLLGPSGSGKSTLLRCIAGLEQPEQGVVRLQGRDITSTPPHRRGFGMMFQQFALFPHLTVAQNVAFGLRMQRVSRQEQQARVDEMLALVGMAGYGAREIFELSGGEQQRVALARSMAPRPALLMLDEPLGSLDRGLRERLVDELRTILKEIGMTALYVTHDQQEAFAISDRLVLMNQGRKEQEGTPEALYRHPASRFAADFFGLRNHVPIQELYPGEAPHEWRAHTPIGTLHFRAIEPPSALLLIRPEAARLNLNINEIRGTVCERSFRGGHYRLSTLHDDFVLDWEISTPDVDLPQIGDPICLFLRPDALTFLPG
jgi:ABC-type Fe3+/spermidine/putrescine transport system ATPase subunit